MKKATIIKVAKKVCFEENWGQGNGEIAINRSENIGDFCKFWGDFNGEKFYFARHATPAGYNIYGAKGEHIAHIEAL